MSGINPDFTEALRRALQQWKSYYEPHIYDDDEEFDLATAQHPEGELYRWCKLQLKTMERMNQPTEGTPCTKS